MAMYFCHLAPYKTCVAQAWHQIVIKSLYMQIIEYMLIDTNDLNDHVRSL